MKRASLIAIALALTGCLKAHLKTPAEDHAVQTTLVAESCAKDGYGSGKCTQEDLDDMAEQAVCIDAVVQATKCGGDE